MNGEEIQSLIKQLKASGLDDEQIMDVFYKTFEKGEMDRKDLEALANAMGYELTDEFKNEPTPDPMAAGSGEGEGGISKEEAEAAKAIEPGESAEEFKEKIEDIKEGEGATPEAGSESPKSEEEKVESESKIEEKKEESTAEAGKEKTSEKSEEEDEEKDWEEAQKLFRI